jgi:dTDP-4-amino-4,6-dideoxygalactose transaminase
MASMRRNIPLFKVYMAKEVDSVLLDTLHSGYIGEGPKVKEFEKNLSACLRVSAHGVAHVDG